jgi:hypothetical protein
LTNGRYVNENAPISWKRSQWNWRRPKGIPLRRSIVRGADAALPLSSAI